MKYKFSGSIFFKDNNGQKSYFKDIYYFDSNNFDIQHDLNYIKAYIKNDLLLVAGMRYIPLDDRYTKIFIYQV